MNRKILAILAVISLVLITGYLAFWPDTPAAPVEEEDHSGEDPTEGLVLIKSEQIAAGEIEVVTTGGGSAVELIFPATVAANPNSSARIDARAAGVVRSLDKTLGDFVRRGETIARIESADAAMLASQVSTARARVGELSASYDRERRLFEANVTARQDLEAARANLQVAQSELTRAQAAVAAAGVSGDGRSLAVTSPLSGRVTAAPIVLGSYVAAGEELYRVVDASGMQVEVALPSAEAFRVQPGDEAILELADGREVGARVRSVTPSLDAESRSATAVLTLTRAIPGLQPGSFLQARIRPSGEVDQTRTSVPEAAVQMLDGREVVFVRVQRGFQARPVTTGARSNGLVIIESGLAAGVQIATENAFLLKSELEKDSAEHGH